ncbi:hypothetical protein CC117_19695 [Parafrankia colletiae]|uniref:Uncharacterized protein n=1 Tax=Parafrankia colletiae TaxID=573497 RepID=A0A1S1QPG1_9ACTN|nr:hypothetical protein [Parafrankia colletiae]MCK9903437.1 hypothetical protein [Frankia sp. Cpl3]OHV35456.1 hypothetical protein CC117_19695 [Parafrankia colletiae]
MKGTRAGLWALAVVALGVLLLGGCAQDDKIYVSNITDGHGRACTFVYTARDGSVGGGEGRDIDVSQLDCEYPPAGRMPGRPTTQPLSAP